ncbi:2-hydroxychromene-2-carboxylate isomerase [Emcibacter sp. SYSU 3D8]|uniref:2-hydroxychromene-2-carboxylate isomerase n=1 Tax=Emcibacter sp. SYSU 3D8 TaxID=3133969 RepID=UPI0031FE6B8E
MPQDETSATFYFDTVSPYAYLMWAALQRLPFGRQIRPVPVVFGAILAHWGQLGPAEVGAKRLHTYRQCQWLAARENIPFRFPPAHPFRSLESLRLIAALDNAEAAITTVFDAIFAVGLDVASPGVLADIGRKLGVPDVPALIAASDAGATLRENTGAAIARGVFGVPTLVVDNELFWGFDSLPMAREYLERPGLFESAEMKRLVDLPVGVSRKRPPPAQQS